MALAKPTQITVPFANSGLKNSIPETSTGSNLASMQEGFPVITMTDVDQGGMPPQGQDMNGILFNVTKAIQYQQAGGLFPYNAAFAQAIDGYPIGALLISADGTKLYRNLLAGNQSNPENGGQNWQDISDIDAAEVTATGSTTPRTLANRFADVVNVKDYGAKGDGRTDDAAAFYAASQEGSVLFCPPGDYVLQTEPAWTGNVYLFAPSGNVNFSGTWGNANISDIANIGYRLVHSDDVTVGISIRDTYSDVGSNTSSINSEISSYGIVTNENHVNRHWGILGSVRSASKVLSSQILGVFGQGWRTSENALPTCWGAVFESRDTSTAGSPGSLVGIEVDCVSNGNSANNSSPYNRVGIHVVGFTHDNTESDTNSLGYAIRVSINNPLTTKWHAALKLDDCRYDYGILVDSDAEFYNSIIDLSGATFNSSATDAVAVRVKEGHKLSFSTNDDTTLHKISGSSVARLILDAKGTPVNYDFSKNYITCPGLDISGTYKLRITGQSIMANAVTLQESPNRYFRFVVSGTTFYIPAFLPA